MARVAGNRALELVALVLIRLTRLHQLTQTSRAARRRISDEVHRAHERIVDAIATGDADLARHRMRRHLHAVATHLA